MVNPEVHLVEQLRSKLLSLRRHGWVLTCNETVRRPLKVRVVRVSPNNSD
jgi:hypothetical protein